MLQMVFRRVFTGACRWLTGISEALELSLGFSVQFCEGASKNEISTGFSRP